jgi:hypothetical protein
MPLICLPSNVWSLTVEINTSFILILSKSIEVILICLIMYIWMFCRSRDSVHNLQICV